MNERTARWLAPATAVLAADVILLVLLGPFGTGAIDYRVSEPLRHRLQGVDAVSLTVLVPLLLTAAWLTRSRRCAGPLLSLGAALTTWYFAAALVLGPIALGGAGIERMFLPLILGVLLLAAAVVVGSWRGLLAGSVRFDRATSRLVAGLVLVVVTVLVLGRYLPEWVALVHGTASSGYPDGPEAWWAVAFTHLAPLLPAMVTTGVGLLRGARWAGMAAFTATGCLALIGTAVTGMAWSAALHGDVSATTGTAWRMTGLAVLMALPAIVCWTAVIRTGRHNLPDGVTGDLADVVAAPPLLTRAGITDVLADLDAVGSLR
ncbi:hypothetical protein [Blastococcus sp. SYSU DS1024]